MADITKTEACKHKFTTPTGGAPKTFKTTDIFAARRLEDGRIGVTTVDGRKYYSVPDEGSKK